MDSDLLCPLCQGEFSDENQAILLTSCGHSYCFKCLTTEFAKGQFACPEDQIVCEDLEVTKLPINQTIMKIVKKSKRRTSEREILKETLSDLAEPNAYNCKEHNLKIEILCLDDFQELCSKCALYGPHKLHNFRPMETVVEEVHQRVNQLCEVFGQLNETLEQFEDTKIQTKVQERFVKYIEKANQQVEDIFNQLYEVLRLKQRKVIEEIAQQCQNFQLYFLQKQRFQLKEVSDSADKWRQCASENLYQFTSQIEKGQIPLEILTRRVEMPKQGEQLTKDLKEKLNQFERALSELPDDLITLRVMKDEFIYHFENCCKVEMPNYNVQEKVVLPDEDIMQDHNFQEENILVTMSQTLHIPNQPASNTGSTQGLSTPSRSQTQSNWNEFDENRSNFSTSAKSTSNASLLGRKKTTKLTKLIPKAEQCLMAIRQDANDFADLSQMELGDDGLNQFIDAIRNSKKLRVLKIMKNKITDDGAIRLIDAIQASQVQALHIQSNLLTERTLEHVFLMSRQNQLSTLKHIYLNQNTIQQVSRHKKKIEELKKYGITVSV